jgi:hypothetical protein
MGDGQRRTRLNQNGLLLWGLWERGKEEGVALGSHWFGEASEKGPAGLGDSARRAHERTNAKCVLRDVCLQEDGGGACGRRGSDRMVCVRAAELCPNNDFVPLGRQIGCNLTFVN